MFDIFACKCCGSPDHSVGDCPDYKRKERDMLWECKCGWANNSHTEYELHIQNCYQFAGIPAPERLDPERFGVEKGPVCVDEIKITDGYTHTPTMPRPSDEEVWLRAWCANSSLIAMKAESCTEEADKCLAAFKERFDD